MDRLSFWLIPFYINSKYPRGGDSQINITGMIVEIVEKHL